MTLVTPGVAQLLEQERRALDAALDAIAIAEAGQTAGALAPPLQYAVAGAGKRLRGALCVLAYRTLGGYADAGIYEIAAAVELAHAYSLVHDDLPCMDDDDLRRGRPTLHRVFGPAVAAVTGAALIPAAFRVLLRGARSLELRSDRTRELALMLARGIGAGGMVGGQWLDLQAEGAGGSTGLTELARIHAAKTGALFAASVGMGAVAAGGSTSEVRAFVGYGAGLGLAFQVVDDLLDETGNAASLGKSAGKDRRQEKATYPALLGADGARRRALAAVHRARAELRHAGIASAELDAVADWVLARHS